MTYVLYIWMKFEHDFIIIVNSNQILSFFFSLKLQNRKQSVNIYYIPKARIIVSLLFFSCHCVNCTMFELDKSLLPRDIPSVRYSIKLLLVSFIINNMSTIKSVTIRIVKLMTLNFVWTRQTRKLGNCYWLTSSGCWLYIFQMKDFKYLKPIKTQSNYEQNPSELLEASHNFYYFILDIMNSHISYSNSAYRFGAVRCSTVVRGTPMFAWSSLTLFTSRNKKWRKKQKKINSNPPFTKISHVIFD